MENWNNSNLPENHQFMENIEFVAVTEGTWQRKKNDGTSEVAQKWDLISKADESGASLQVSVFSSTDKEEIKLNTPYDIIAKRAVGKDGTFYGYTLKGFAPHGQPIPKKEPQSRWNKSQKTNTKAYAIQAASVTVGQTKNPDEVIMVAQIFNAWINDEYEPEVKENKDKK